MLKELNRVIDEIEKNLLEDIDISKLTRKSGMNEYHLKRTFSYLTGVTITEYIKLRRLALANADIVNGLSVTDAAFKYGYESLEGFSRSFKSFAGFSPMEAKLNKRQKSYQPLRITISVKGGISMEFRIEEKKAFNLVGVTKRVPIQFEGVNNSIIELAQSITEEQRKNMRSLGDMYPNQVVNASFNFDEGRLEEKGELTHMIGFISSKDNPYDNLERIHVSENTWAIFPCTGPFPQTLQDTMAKTFSEWLPSSDYELVDAPEISFTAWGVDMNNVYSEVWLAVKKKG